LPSRSCTTFKKRQKELLRIEKQREKAARRLARRSASEETSALESDVEHVDEVEPRDDDPAISKSGNAPSV
jgi:hypothetical protein